MAMTAHRTIYMSHIGSNICYINQTTTVMYFVMFDEFPLFKSQFNGINSHQ